MQAHSTSFKIATNFFSSSILSKCSYFSQLKPGFLCKNIMFCSPRGTITIPVPIYFFQIFFLSLKIMYLFSCKYVCCFLVIFFFWLVGCFFYSIQYAIFLNLSDAIAFSLKNYSGVLDSRKFSSVLGSVKVRSKRVLIKYIYVHQAVYYNGFGCRVFSCFYYYDCLGS